MVRGLAAMYVATSIVVGCTFDASGDAVSSGGSSGGPNGSESGTTLDPSAGSSSGARTTGPETTDATSTTDAPGTSSESTAAVVDDTGASSSSTGTKAVCDRALWVSGDTNVEQNGDTPLYERLVALGFEITVVQSLASSADDVADNCVVILSALGSSSDIGSKFVDTPVGVVVLEPGLYDEMGFVPTAADAWWGEGHDDIAIVDPAHPLAAGLADIVAVYDGGGLGSWALPVASAQIVAVWPGDSTRATLFAHEAGATLAQELVAPARRVGFPGGTSPVPMTEARIDLFEAAVRWAAGDLP